jgi:hypothetical protein
MSVIRRAVLAILVVLLVSLLASCALIPLLGSFLGISGQRISFDLTGAKAVGGANTMDGRALVAGAAGAKNVTDNSLVKIMENGDIESIISISGPGGWSPEVAFISVGSDESIYICFTGTWGTDRGLVQFIRVYNEPGYPYDVIWPPVGEDWTAGMVNTWNWWGVDTDPLAKGDDGKLYFKVQKSNGMYQEDVLYCYDPSTKAPVTSVTPEGMNLAIERFLVDGKGHVFIQSLNGGYNGNSASFMRYYTPGVTSPKNIYYSSNGSIWVRGFVSDPAGNFLIINGWNIPSGSGTTMSGIMKATIVSASEVTYAPLYPTGGVYDNVGKMVWLSDGSLYGLYDGSWWGGSNATGAVQLLDSSGAVTNRSVALTHSTDYPSKMKIIGDWIYYRYAILDAGQETGKHKLARFNVRTKNIGDPDDELLGAGVPEAEILAYDVADDNSLLYFVAYELATNSVFGGRVDLATKAFMRFDMATKLNSIRIVH